MHATRYSQIKANQERLPKPLLILDLDETIIHTTNQRIDTAWDFETTNFYVYIRPGLAKFIEAIQAHYKLAVWTAATKEYTSTILSGLPFSENDCEFVWTRQDCDFRASECGATLPIKNTAKIKASYPDATTVIIDDKPEFVVFDIEKVIPVKPFYGNQNDQELERVLAALLSLID